jgi:hypothetical protein
MDTNRGEKIEFELQDIRRRERAQLRLERASLIELFKPTYNRVGTYEE